MSRLACDYCGNAPCDCTIRFSPEMAARIEAMNAEPVPSGRPTVGALFAGYGGIELALRDVFDAEPLWFSEFDPAPSKILAHRFPGVPNLGDVTKIRWQDAPHVDIITGGSPCQDLSHAGKRKGMKAGTRSGLWASMCDAIDIIRPALVVWENVRGALSAEATAGDVESCDLCVGDGSRVNLRALGRVLGDLAELGYDAAWTGLRAADVGAPHGRFRVFVLAWPADSKIHFGSRPDSRGLDCGPTALTLLSTPQARDYKGRPADGFNTACLVRDVEDLVAPLLPTPAVNDMGRAYTPETWDAWTERMKAAHGNGNGHGASLSIEALRMLPTPRATDGTKGGPNQRGSSGDVMLPSAVGIDFGQYAPAIARWEALTRPAPAPTEPTGRDGAHRLSPAFVEWLMGLPAGWVTDVPDVSRNDQLKALGNGVVPQQCAAAVRHLLAIRSDALGSAAA